MFLEHTHLSGNSSCIYVTKAAPSASHPRFMSPLLEISCARSHNTLCSSLWIEKLSITSSDSIASQAIHGRFYILQLRLNVSLVVELYC